MRIALSIDNVLTKYDQKLEEWRGAGNSDPSIFNDDAFWANLSPHEDIKALIDYIAKWTYDEYIPHEFIFMCERPESKRLVTLTWLKRHGLKIDKDKLIMNAIYRFDCQQLGVNYFIHQESAWTPWYVHTWGTYGRTMAVAIRRDLTESEYEPEGDFYRSHNLGRALSTALADACGG